MLDRLASLLASETDAELVRFGLLCKYHDEDRADVWLRERGMAGQDVADAMGIDVLPARE